MAEDPPSSNNEPGNSQRRRSLLGLGFSSETTPQPGSVSGLVTLTPSTPNAVKSTLAVVKHGTGTALDSVWIQRLKPASVNSSSKGLELQSSLLPSNCGRKDDPVSGAGSKPSEGVFDKGAEVIARFSRPRQSGEESREEAAATAPWEWIEKVSSNHVVLSGSRNGRVCGEAYEMEKSHLVMGMKGLDTHPHARESFYQQRIKQQFGLRQKAHQASALSNANKGFEIENKGFENANKGIGSANKGIGNYNKGSDTHRETREMNLKGLDGLHYKNELKEDSVIHRGASASCLQLSKESPGKAKGNLWFCQTEGHMRAIVPKADILKRGFPLLTDTAKKEGMMASSLKLKAEGIVSNLDNPKISPCSPTVTGFGPLRTSFRKPPLSPSNVAPKTVSTDRAILFRSNGSYGEASLKVGESERKMAWELSKRSLCASSVADKEENVYARISSKATHREDPVLERAVEKELCAVAFDSRNLEVNFLESLEQPLSSHVRHHGFCSPVAMNSHASIGLSLRTGWLEDSFAAKFKKRSLWKDLMANSTGIEQDKNEEQLATSQEEDNETDASVSRERQGGGNDSASEPSPTSVVQLFKVADNVRVYESSSSTASLPLELQKLHSCDYAVSNFSVSENNMSLCEEKSQKRQRSKEAQLDLNQSLSSSGEEDQTPSEDFQSERREVESFPVIQQSNGQKLPHSLAGGTQRPKFVLSTITNDKKAGDLFSCSAKRSRPNENEGGALLKSDGETNASTGGNEGEVKGCMRGSRYSWLHHWHSPPQKTSTLRLSEPVHKSKENDQNNTFGSDFMNISRSDAFRNIWNESFQAKAASRSSLQENETPIQMTAGPPGPSAQGSMEFFSYGASSSRAYITSSAAALALAGTVPKQGGSSPSRCKGFLEVFPSAGRRHSFHRSKRLHEEYMDPRARNDDVQNAEHSISSS